MASPGESLRLRLWSNFEASEALGSFAKGLTPSTLLGRYCGGATASRPRSFPPGRPKSWAALSDGPAKVAFGCPSFEGREALNSIASRKIRKVERAQRIAISVPCCRTATPIALGIRVSFVSTPVSSHMVIVVCARPFICLQVFHNKLRALPSALPARRTP
jgi:hypothetical protein